MYRISLSLTVDNIFKKLSSYDIFKRYCPGFKEVSKAFHSPFRTDKHPSAFIVYYNGDLLFKDFGGDSLRAIAFVSKLFDLTFPETLKKINSDFGLGLENGEINNSKFENSKITIYDKDDLLIKIKKRNWEQKDLDYWFQYGITSTTLKLFDVCPISHYSLNGFIEIAENFSYSYNYYWENGIFRRKIYQPFSSKKKWINNGGKVVQGEGMLPKSGDLLIITSSLKDVMTLYELGYIAIAPTSETSFIPELYFEKQSSRFKSKILFFDSDDTGIKRSKELSEKWNINYILIPRENDKDPKDISDFVKRNGENSAKKLIEQILSEKLS